MFMTGELLAAIVSPRRREILRLLWDGELSAGAVHEALPDVTFGAISLQLRALREAGLVDARRDSRNRYYKVRKDALGDVRGMLEQMWDDSLWRLKLEAELEASRRGPRPGHKRRARARARTRGRASSGAGSGGGV
jgi:DNA-binding transcriptional ArsR family regulator